MRHRKAELLAGESATTAGTKTVDIDVTDPISRIQVRFKGTNSSNDPTAHPAAMVSKIEVVDGSDVLYSCSGYEAQALDTLSNRRQRLDVLDYVDDEMCIPVFNLNFGRKLFDRQLALDPKRHRNPQIKITHNKASGGCAPDAGNLRIFADIFDDDPPSPVGFLMAKEYKEYDLSSSGYEYVDLPLDHPLRKLIIMARFGGKQPWEQVNQVRLSEDNDKKIPLDVYVSDWLAFSSIDWGMLYEMMRIKGTASTANNYYITPCYEVAVSPVSALTAGHFLAEESYGGVVSITPEQTGDDMCIVTGFSPHGAIGFPFGDQDDITDWYDVTQLSKLQARLKGGSSVGSSSKAQVVTEQFRSY